MSSSTRSGGPSSDLDDTERAERWPLILALTVDSLSVRFFTRDKVVQAISDMSFAVKPGETMVIVGESGCGKTVLAHTLLRLLPMNARVEGRIGLGDTLLTSLSDAEMNRVRRRSIALIPQSAATALNPVLTIGTQLREIALARGIAWADAQHVLEDVFSSLGLEFSRVRHLYPYQLSGGMQQRVVIATTMLGDPVLVIADEPTFGMDPELVDTTAALLREIPKIGAALLVITHDLRFARQLGGRIGLMYGSYLMELRGSERFFAGPLHPYGQGLLGALPENGLREIPGFPPDLTDLSTGCPFAPRCPQVNGKCTVQVSRPIMTGEGENEMVRCMLYA